jgi:serine/threonine-protein kinase
MSDANDDPLDEVLARYLRAADSDRAPPPQSLLALYPEWEGELREFFADQDQVEALAAPVRSAVLARHFAQSPSPADRPGERLGPYRLDEEVGRGGMGVVYRAWDTQLNRTVAVKTIRTPARATPEALARFRSEAVAVARLQHPNIVQVFETGEHDGQPYAVLEYVPGGSLAQLLTGRPLAPAVAAALVETLARAVHYAHQRGVIHRDLKPANILLSGLGDRDSGFKDDVRGGRSSSPNPDPRIPNPVPKITDFGLAKVLDDGGAALTETGAVLGTPTYMAPEQAHGRVGEVGPAADVYALGVLLYELITGRPPFCGVTKLDTLRQVTNDPPTPPRQLAADCPRDLETVCLRCLEKDPVRRYASAEVLADELRRFLDGKPILARPVGPFGRAWRWCRRQPWLATLIAALSVCTALLGLQWWRAERNADAARRSAADAQTHASAADHATREANRLLTEAVEQRQRAEARFGTARGAVRDLAVWLSENALARIPSLQPVRKELLDRAVGYYEGFVRDKGDDPALRFELADLCFRSAQLTSNIGSKTDALDRYRRAAELYDGLLRDDPANQRYLAEQGYILNNSGILHNDLGDLPRAAAAYRAALDVYARLREANPGDLGYQDSTAKTLYNLGIAESDAGEFGPALDHLGQARAIRAELVKADPASGPYALLLTDVDHHIAVAYTRLGRRDEARDAHDRVRAAREDLAKKYPKNTDVQLALAESYRFLGEEQRHAGRPDEAAATQLKALAALDAAGKINPNLTRLPLELAATLVDLSEAHRARRRYEEALDALQRARAVRERLTRLYPQSRPHKAALAYTYYRLGVVHAERQQRAEARQSYTVARDLWEEVTRSGPTPASYRFDHSRTLHGLGMELAEIGRHDEAVEHLRTAAAIARELVAQVPNRPLYREALALRYAGIAEVELKRGRPAEVVAAARERVALFPKDPAQLVAAARDVALAAELPDKDGRRKEYVRLAVETLRAAVANGFTDAARIDRDRAFGPVRSDPEFRELMAGLRRLP